MNTSNFAMTGSLADFALRRNDLNGDDGSRSTRRACYSPVPMAENDKGLGSKFLGLFVEREGQAEGNTSAADEIAELAKQSGAAAPPPAAAAPPPLAPPPLKVEKLAGTSTDFDAVFRDAGMDPAE